MPSTSKHYVITCYHFYVNGIFPGLLFILCCFGLNTTMIGVSQVVLVVKNPPASAGDMKDVGSIIGLGRSPGGGNGNPFQYSCLEIPMVGQACQAMVHRVAKSWTRLTQLSTHIPL